jgi:signal peptidase II
LTTNEPKRSLINRSLEFLKPTPIKLVFLAEWILYVLFEAVLGSLPTADQLITLAYPLALYYLIACLLARLSQGYSGTSRLRVLLGLSLALVAIEQAIKLGIAAWLPMGASIPIIPGRISLSQSHNLYNSFLFNRFGWDISQSIWLPLFSLLFAALLIQGYRYYVFTARRSFWADLALVALLAGVLGALVDQVVRGYALDFISFAGYFVADLKDAYLSFGIGAVLAETIVNPNPDRKSEAEGSDAEEPGFLEFTWREIQNLFGRDSR